MPKSKAPVETQPVSSSQQLANAPVAAAQQMVATLDQMNTQTTALAQPLGAAVAYHLSGQALFDAVIKVAVSERSQTPTLEFDPSAFEQIAQTLQIQRQDVDSSREQALQGFTEFMGQARAIRGGVGDAYALTGSDTDYDTTVWSEEKS